MPADDEILNKILEAAGDLAASLSEDISLCKTREEHVRVTARANEAAAIVSFLNYFVEERRGNG